MAFFAFVRVGWSTCGGWKHGAVAKPVATPDGVRRASYCCCKGGGLQQGKRPCPRPSEIFRRQNNTLEPLR